MPFRESNIEKGKGMSERERWLHNVNKLLNERREKIEKKEERKSGLRAISIQDEEGINQEEAEKKALKELETTQKINALESKLAREKKIEKKIGEIKESNPKISAEALKSKKEELEKEAREEEITTLMEQIVGEITPDKKTMKTILAKEVDWGRMAIKKEAKKEWEEREELAKKAEEEIKEKSKLE